MKHLIYLHGFLSSPKSEKAQLVSSYLQSNHPDILLHVPALSGNPDLAVATIEEIVKGIIKNKDTPVDSLRFVGSSMGGFLSTYFVETYGGKAVLINPAVEPFNLLKAYMGQHVNPYTGEVFVIDEGSVDKLLKLNKDTIQDSPNYLVYLQKEDETLDYQLAEKKYGCSRCVTEEGGNHSFVGFENHLDDMITFLSED